MDYIGKIHSPFKEKFSIPRQAMLLDIEMQISILPPYNRAEAFIGLSEFSHAFIIYDFHAISKAEEKLVVRPPRLGGNIKQGVFATRSPFRPNRIGLSIVKILSVTKDQIIISGGDFLDQTPVYDIKPYLVDTDAIIEAKSSWTSMPTSKLQVEILSNVTEILDEKEIGVIKKILALDPRPAYHEDQFKTYGSKLFNYDLAWKVDGDILTVFDCKIL